MQVKNNRAKVVWLINQYAVLPNKFGGTRHYDFAEELSKKANLHFYIIASGFSNFERKENKQYSTSLFNVEKISKNISFVWIKTPPYGSNGSGRLLNCYIFSKRIIKLISVIGRPDLIIGSSPHLLGADSGLRIAKKINIPFILEIRDIWPQAIIELGMNKFHPLMIYFKFLEKKLLTQSDRIIALMPYFQQYIKDLNINIDLKKITWISNGIADRYIRNFTKIPKESKIEIIYAGTIGSAQNISNIVYCAKRLEKMHDIKFKIIGNGVEKEKLIRLSRKLGLKNISFLKPVPKNNLVDRLRDANGLILSIKSSGVYSYGNSPNKLFDYLSAGRPIIFSSSAKNNLIKLAKCGFTANPDSVRSLEKSVLKLYNCDSKRKQQMGMNAIRYVRRNYAISELAKKYLNLIKEIL